MVQMAKNILMEKIQNYKDALSTRSRPVESIPGEVSVMIVPFAEQTGINLLHITNYCLKLS